MANANSKPSTPANVAPANKEIARGYTYTGTLACGTPVTVQHVVRRCYAVSIKGKVAGYITAATPTNALYRVAANTVQTLKLHALAKHPNAATAATLAQLAKH